jgi:FAD/FMN-containing dehydrogenase/Fe-S oxidoreductase
MTVADHDRTAPEDRNRLQGWTRSPDAARWPGNAEALARDLRRAVDGPVRFDRGSRALYSTDASNYRQVPIGVVLPRHAGDVEAVFEVCRHHGAPILARGGGTSLAGQCCNVAVVLDFTRFMHRVLDVDPERGLAMVEPGCVLDDLRAAAAEHGLTFGPDPATHTHCTLGGMIGNNSCGVHSVMAGRTADNVHSLDVLTYDGTRFTAAATGEDAYQGILQAGGRPAEILHALKQLAERHGDEVRRRYPDIPRRVSGYNLDELLPEKGFHVGRALVGSEGTLATVLAATVELVPRLPWRALVVVSYEDAYAAADHVMEILEHEPIGLEGLDSRLVEDQRKKHMHPDDLELLPRGGGWLLVELGADEAEEAAQRAHRLRDLLAGKGSVIAAEVFTDPGKQARIWEIRESGLGATARVPGEGDTWPGWEDSAVAPERMGTYMRELRELMGRFGYDGAFYGHFGDGCLHTRINFDLVTAGGLADYRRFVDRAADLVMRHGGVLSGEHGDGQARAELLPKLYGEEIAGALREMKGIFDPGNRMNPGKVVDPYPILDNLRLGADYRPWEPETDFAYPHDDHRFSRAALRCVGVGKCRRESGGTMCPSYRVTGEEMHSTRGRARLLFEMLRGDVITDGWRSEEVKEALDLCLACKGCKSDCPADVDMATYKAEFLSHYYAGRLRPPAAYSMGLIYWWARLAAKAPRLVNFATQTPGLSHLAKLLGGISQRRRVPRFAHRTFRAGFAARRPGAFAGKSAGVRAPGSGVPAVAHRRRVVLWPDTFNNFFDPAVAHAAVDVLEAAGWEVVVPRAMLCCGRPLYDYGFLGVAKKLLREIVDELAPEIEDGVPVVGLEPSCVATFRDELVNLLPGDRNAERLARQTWTLAELLEQKADGGDGEKARPLDGFRLEGRAVYHAHCHHKAVMDARDETNLLERLGLVLETPDTGCCGMAGAFGFERDKYDLSMACGERVLLPAVRGAGRGELVIADGFSCREQIAQGTGRRALHTAQVLELALDGGAGPLPEPPERRVPGPRGGRRWPWLLAAAAAAGAGYAAWKRRR